MVALTWNIVFELCLILLKWIVTEIFIVDPPIMTEFEFAYDLVPWPQGLNCGCSFGSEVNITIHVTSWSLAIVKKMGKPWVALPTIMSLPSLHVSYVDGPCMLWDSMHFLWENPRLMNENNQWCSMLTHATSPMSSHGLELCQFGLLTWDH